MSVDGSYTIAVLGSGGVGKTCLILALTQGKFDPEYIPTIQDYFEKNVDVGDKNYNLKIIDTAGQIEMSGITDIAIKDAEGFIIVYSVTSEVTFTECQKIYEKVQQFSGQSAGKVVLCGNKCDLAGDRVVARNQGEELAKQWKCPFLETSAKDMINIDQVFQSAVRVLNGEYSSEPGKSDKGSKAKSGGDKKKEGGCCEVA